MASRSLVRVAVVIGVALATAACEAIYSFDGYVDGATQAEGGDDAAPLDAREDVEAEAEAEAATTPCTTDCLGGACAQGRCLPALVASLRGATSFAIDDAGIYVTFDVDGGAAGGVARMDKDGSNLLVLVTDAGAMPAGITVDASRIYWTARPGSVLSVAKSGGAPVLLSALESSPAAIAVDDSNVFVANATTAGGTKQTLVRFAKDGGGRTAIVAGAGDGKRVLVDDRFVYLLDQSSISYVSKTCGDAAPCAAMAMRNDSNLFDVYELAQDEGAIYWTDRGDGIVVRDEKGGDASTAVPLTPKTNATLTAITVDDARIYYVVSGAASEIWVVAKTAGSTPMPLTDAGLASATGLVNDERAVYWLDLASGAIRRLAK